MNDLSKSLKILVDRYPGTMAELARQAQIDRSSLYKIMDGKRMPNRAQLQRLIHALGLNARQAEHLTTQYDELRSGAQAHRTDEALYELLQTAMRSRDNLMDDVLAPMPRSEADLEAAFTSRCYQGYQAVTQQLYLLLTRYLRSEEKRPLMLSPFVGERALSSILIGAFSAEASPKPVWHLLRFVTNNDAQENFIGNVNMGEAEVTIAPCIKSDTLMGALRNLFASIKPGDYFALDAFLPFDGEGRREALEVIRHGVADKLGVVSCLEIGPRYLHSTGQLQKGGTNNGVFLMVSANELKDIPLRHVEPESLGMLARTQAAADLSILIERGRRCMHLHLPDNSGVTIRALGDAVMKVLDEIERGRAAE